MTLRKSDIFDADFFDADELSSDGYRVYLSASLIGTNSSLQQIELSPLPNGESLLYLIDNPIEYMDTIYLTGTSGADGYYSVNQILTDVILSTNENINTSTGGTIYFMHPSGASKIGIDPTGITGVTSNNLQDAIKELSQNATGVTPSQHEILRQLIHFIDNGPAEGFASGAYRETLPSASPFPTSIIWWEDSSKINKIVEKTITYNSNKTPNIIEWKMYDITNSLLATVTDNIVYSGVFELNRTRTIV